MATYDTLASLDSFMKQYYGNYDSVEAAYSKSYPLLSMIPKKENVEGNPMKIPMLTSDGAGVSGNYTSAASSAQGLSGPAFYVQPGDFVAVVPLDYKSMLAIKNKGGFIDYVGKSTDAKLGALGRAHAKFLFGNGGGAIGQRLSIASNTITLASAEDTINFWPNMVIRASTGDGTNIAHTQRVGSAVVQSVNRESGTVTFVNAAAITGFANNDYLFIDGLFAGDQSQVSVMKGIPAWLTTTAATDTLWTVPRTNYPELSGYRNPTAATDGGVVDRFRKLATFGFRTYSGKVGEVGVMFSDQWEIAAKTLQNQGYRPIEVSKTETVAGYKKLAIVGQFGEVSLIGDPFCPGLTGYILDLESIQIAHLGEKLVNFVKSPEGNMYVASPTNLGHEVRIASYPNVAMDAPWKHGSTPLPVMA
jgi:hypothetical protein